MLPYSYTTEGAGNAFMCEIHDRSEDTQCCLVFQMIPAALLYRKLTGRCMFGAARWFAGRTQTAAVLTSLTVKGTNGSQDFAR